MHYYKADRNDFLSAYSGMYTVDIKYKIKICDE